MTVYYLETSALLKRYKSESGSEIVTSLFEEKQASETFVTSHLSVLEVSSVAARLLKGRVIRQGQYRRMLGTFIQDLTTYGMVVIPVHNTLVSESIELVRGIRSALRMLCSLAPPSDLANRLGTSSSV
jgi:hypothetical protein